MLLYTISRLLITLFSIFLKIITNVNYVLFILFGSLVGKKNITEVVHFLLLNTTATTIAIAIIEAIKKGRY